MEQNLGKTDRIIRLMVGISLFFVMRSFQNNTIQIVLFVASVLTIFNALTGWCGIYKIFGMNTCTKK